MSPELTTKYVKCECGANCDVFDAETCSGPVRHIDSIEVLDGVKLAHRCAHHVDDYWSCLKA